MRSFLILLFLPLMIFGSGWSLLGATKDIYSPALENEVVWKYKDSMWEVRPEFISKGVGYWVKNSSVATPAISKIEEIPVVVVGAGIAGLSASWMLKKEGIEFLLLEKEKKVGGRTISRIHKGYSYAMGTEYLGEPEGVLKNILDDLKIKSVEIKAPADGRFDGKNIYLGFEDMNRYVIEKSSLEDYNNFVELILKSAKDYQELPYFDEKSSIARLDSMSVREWFDEQNVAKIFYDIYNVAAKGLFGANIDEISALSFIPEIAFEYEGMVLPLSSIDDLSPESLDDIRSGSYSFTTGITELTDALARYLENELRLESLVVSIEKDGSGYLVGYRDSTTKLHKIRAKSVILATPAPISAKIAKNVLSSEQLSLLGEIPYASYTTVALFSDVPLFDKAFDLAMPEGWFFTDIYDATWIQRANQAGLDKDVGIMTIYASPQSYKDLSTIKLSDEKLLENIYRDLEKVIPNAKDKITGYDIQRHYYAYPVMTKGAYGRLKMLYLSQKDGLFLAGDYMIYPTFESAVDSGAMAGENAIEFLE